MSKLAALSDQARQYLLVTGNYWAFTLTDGALRMLVVLYFHQLGYSPLEVAMLFLFYEIFGVVTNLIGGYLGARLGLNVTMNVGLALQVTRMASAGVRQGDLFARGWRDPLEAAAALSRLRARLGGKGVVWPAPRASHRPEIRNRWVPVRLGESRPKAAAKVAPGEVAELAADERQMAIALPPVLRLFPRPVPVEVRAEGGRPAVVWDESGRREVTAAEGPERLSGDWWETPYRREYYRVCTSEGELLWLFRARDRGGKDRWWLHGWWD